MVEKSNVEYTGTLKLHMKLAKGGYHYAYAVNGFPGVSFEIFKKDRSSLAIRRAFYKDGEYKTIDEAVNVWLADPDNSIQNLAKKPDTLPAPPEHEWHEYHGLQCCKNCGIVKRLDGVKNKPCKGRVKVTTRED